MIHKPSGRLVRSDALTARPSFGIGRTMQRQESFIGEGFVTIRPFKLVDGEQVFVDDYARHNLIVQVGRASLIDLLIGNTNRKLKYIRWGKGGALAFPAGDPLQPLVVQDTDHDVASFLLDKPLSAPERISPTQVAFNETLISDEVDSIVNEAVMLFEDPSTLDRIAFARITFPTVPLTRDHGMGIALRWVFNFSRADEV